MTYVERCMYDYKANVASLEILNLEKDSLMSMQGASYDILSAGGTSDPVSEVASRVIALEKKIEQVKKRVNPIDKLKSDLQGSAIHIQQMSEILRLKYIEHESNEFVQRKLAISCPTLWRRTRELIRLAKKYFGEYERSF